MESSEGRYKRLVWYLTDYIYTVRIEDGRFVDTDHGPGCFAVTGYSSEEFAKDPQLWFRMVVPDDRDYVTECAQRALRGENVGTIEHRILHRDRSVRWVRNTIILRKNDSGRLLSYDGLIRDVTEHKRAEKETQIKQQQLIQADKMTSLGILVSGIAHEIFNPTNFIHLNAKLLLRVWEDIAPILEAYYRERGEFFIAGMPYSENCNMITQSISGTIDGTNRITTIIENLKAFARRDPGELNEHVDINAVVKAAVVLLNNPIRKATRRFHVAYGKNLPLIRGNFQQLEQVIVNLITNACQALDHRNRSVKVLTGYELETQSLKVQVSDDGVGIEKENLNSILDPFFTTKRDQDGTGLGLSISYQIIQHHGGDLAYQSEVGKGTTMTVALPAIHRKTQQGQIAGVQSLS
jgi:PAS domain S-box-containing protein